MRNVEPKGQDIRRPRNQKKEVGVANMAEFYREEQLERAQFSPKTGEFRVGVGYASQEDSVAGGN